jgi:hypothetical protein
LLDPPVAAVLLARRRNPGGKASLHRIRVQRRKDPVEGVVRRNAAGQLQKRLEPLLLLVQVVIGNVISTLGTAQNGGNGDEQNLFQ